MNAQQVKELIKRYNAGTLNPEEKLQLNQWYNDEAAKDKERLSGHELAEISTRIRTGLPLKYTQRHISLWPRIAVAASIILAIGAGVLFYTNRPATKTIQTDAYANDIAPGKQGATLTLANGKKIRLTDAVNGELAKEAGVVITKSANGQLIYEVKDTERESNKINVLSTAQGETYQVRLPDGSLVWLNAASSLTYSASLNERGLRRVKLDGEAYFEIFKDKGHPFIVESRGQQVEVLGTHFNVSSYADEANIKTTLLEGSVKVSANTNSIKAVSLVKILKPGQQALLGDDGLSVQQADIETDLAWKNGDFVFDHEDFESIIRKVEKWYDIKFVYQKGKYNTLTLSGSVSRSNPLSVVLVSLQKAGNLKFKVEGRRITIL